MHKVYNGMVPTYIANLIPPPVREISGCSSEIIVFFLHHLLEQMFQLYHVYHQLSECRTTLMKVLKNKPTISSFKHNLQITTFQKYKYLAISHFEKDICLYYMLELETTVVI